MVRRENPKWPTAAASTTLSVYQKNIVEQSQFGHCSKSRDTFLTPDSEWHFSFIISKRSNFNSAIVNLFLEKL